MSYCDICLLEKLLIPSQYCSQFIVRIFHYFQCNWSEPHTSQKVCMYMYVHIYMCVLVDCHSVNQLVCSRALLMNNCDDFDDAA